MSERRDNGGGLSLQTLVIASLSSLAAALFIHTFWQGGAILGAAVTPVIVALAAFLLTGAELVLGGASDSDRFRVVPGKQQRDRADRDRDTPRRDDPGGAAPAPEQGDPAPEEEQPPARPAPPETVAPEEPVPEQTTPAPQSTTPPPAS